MELPFAPKPSHKNKTDKAGLNTKIKELGNLLKEPDLQGAGENVKKEDGEDETGPRKDSNPRKWSGKYEESKGDRIRRASSMSSTSSAGTPPSPVKNESRGPEGPFAPRIVSQSTERLGPEVPKSGSSKAIADSNSKPFNVAVTSSKSKFIDEKDLDMEQEIAALPLITPEAGLKQLKLENDEVKLAKWRQQQKIKPQNQAQKRRIYEEKGNYLEPAMVIKILKTSMRFVPGENQVPNIQGDEYDPPYLFKEIGRIVELRIESIEDLTRQGSGEVPFSEKVYNPAFGLAWPSTSSLLLKKAHENMLVALLRYYSYQAGIQGGETVPYSVYDPNLSISCAVSCGKSPFPKFQIKNMGLGGSFTQLPAPPEVLSHQSNLEKNVKQFGPTGFATKVDLGSRKLPDNFVKVEVPVFPDLGLHDIGIPAGKKGGFMDAAGTFHEAQAGDTLPEDATIGYLDDNGSYHKVVDVESIALQNGKLSVIQGYAEKRPPKLAPIPHPKVGIQLPLSDIVSELSKSINLFNAGNRAPVPGAINQHQSQANFQGVGTRKAHNVEANHPDEPLTDEKPKKEKKEKTREEKRRSRKHTQKGEEEEEDELAGEFEDYVFEEELEQSDNEYSGEEDDDEPEIPVYVVEERHTGYTTKEGEFVELKPEDGIPDGATVGYLDNKGQFQRSQSKVGYVEDDGKFVELKPGTEQPPNVDVGYMGEDDKFHPKPVSSGYRNPEGDFVELQKHELPPPGSTVGYTTKTGKFVEERYIPDTAVPGYIEHGEFRKLSINETPPEGVAVVYKNASSGQVIPLRDAETGFFDSNGDFQQSKHEIKQLSVIPPGSTMGYIDDKNEFHKLKAGQKVPRGSLIGYKNPSGEFTPVTDGGGRKLKKKSSQPSQPARPSHYIENPNEIVEVEIHDEENLDNQGKPRVSIVLRHRASIEPPIDAKEIEGGGKVWMEGDEEVTELPYLDENDKDATGQPKVKKMRVRKRIDKPKYGRAPRGRPPKKAGPGYEIRYTDEEAELREAPLGPEERERLLEFQKSIAVQVELDYIAGSLDLGEVSRRSFRIYSHGGSIDIEPNLPKEQERKKMMSTSIQAADEDIDDDNIYFDLNDDQEDKVQRTNDSKSENVQHESSYPEPS